MTSTNIAQEIAPIAGMPIDILEALLRDHLGDQSAVITDCDSAPLTHEGTNDSTTLFRVTLSWASANRLSDARTATWIIKRWKAGGVRDSALGIAQTREALAWEQGWLRPAALPAGVVVPFTGARRSPDNTETWLAMDDVSAELSAYQRMALTGEQAIERTRAILARLARFHALWEQPERQAELRAAPWLRRPDQYLWDLAPTYAQALGLAPIAQTPPEAYAPRAWHELSADVEAFLEARPADERRLWERLLTDRQALVEGLAPYPQTLLHHDLDDRNIGLRWPGGAESGSAAPGSADLVLIDWEWMALGPAALDVANLTQRLPVMIRPGAAIPEAGWTDELADGYFAHYHAAGGRCADAEAWRRAYGLAVVAQGLAQMPFLHGSMRRTIRGELPPPEIVGVSADVVREMLGAGLPVMEQMERRVFREARRWLG